MGIDSFLISNIALDDNHEEHIGSMIQGANRVRIISPYISDYGIDFVLKNIKKDAHVEIVTALSVSGILSGSQSPKCLARLFQRENCEIYYYTNNLHSKVYILDDQIYITSANLTKGGLVSNMESGLTVNKYLKDKISSNLRDRVTLEVEVYWEELVRKAIDLDEDELHLWIEKEIELKDRKKEYDELIEKHNALVPKKDYKNFDRELKGRDFITEIRASSKHLKLEPRLWDYFRHSFQEPTQTNLNSFRYILDENINPILSDIFSLIKMNKAVNLNITNLSYSFSKNLQAKFFPNYRYLFITKIGIGGDLRKRHIEFPTYILSMGIDGADNWFEIRSGVEEENSTRLCRHARHFLEQIKNNIDECVVRLNRMGKGWSIIHGDGKKGERVIVPVDKISKNQILIIINDYLTSGGIADFHISRKYYQGTDIVLDSLDDFIESLAKDLNELNYFFELAHY